MPWPWIGAPPSGGGGVGVGSKTRTRKFYSESKGLKDTKGDTRTRQTASILTARSLIETCSGPTTLSINRGDLLEDMFNQYSFHICLFLILAETIDAK